MSSEFRKPTAVVEINLGVPPVSAPTLEPRLRTALGWIAERMYADACRFYGKEPDWIGLGFEARNDWRKMALSRIERQVEREEDLAEPSPLFGGKLKL